MPFVSQTSRPFTRQNIESLNVNQSGVYGLLKTGVYIYIGKGDIRQRLLDHFNGDNPCISRHQPTHWVGEVVTGDPSSREETLIMEINPVCNQRVG